MGIKKCLLQLEAIVQPLSVSVKAVNPEEHAHGTDAKITDAVDKSFTRSPHHGDEGLRESKGHRHTKGNEERDGAYSILDINPPMLPFSR